MFRQGVYVVQTSIDPFIYNLLNPFFFRSNNLRFITTRLNNLQLQIITLDFQLSRKASQKVTRKATYFATPKILETQSLAIAEAVQIGNWER